MSDAPRLSDPVNEALDWDLSEYTQADRCIRIGTAIANLAFEAVSDSMPDVKNDFPTQYSPVIGCHFDEDWFVIRLVYTPQAMFTLTALSQEEIDLLKLKGAALNGKSPQEIEAALGPKWISRSIFTYFGPISGSTVSFRDMGLKVLEWLNYLPLEMALSYNRARIERAIPTPPNYEIDTIFGALWVLECDEKLIQGTAFALKDVGLVTCDHCLGSATKAFRYDGSTGKLDISIIKRHSAIDIAIIEMIDSPAVLETGDPNELKHMDHLLVVGHPNHRSGEPPLISPGMMIGRRVRSGIQRILTNAAIVTGGSGGPVLNAAGKVVGVAVTGSDSFSSSQKTEDHSIIPIDALELLQ